MTKKINTKARAFVASYWFDNSKPSKAIIAILKWHDGVKFTKLGLLNYKKLCQNCR